MTSQSENSVSEEFGELLQLLNALEAQDSRPIENFATLERLLAAGKVSPAESFSHDHQSEDHQAEDHPFEVHQFEDGQPDNKQFDDHRSDDQSDIHQSGIHATDDDHQSEIGGGISVAAEPTSSDELIAQRTEWREEEKPQAESENRLAVHIIQGLRKSIKDWTS
ncbi:MAG TPA: hypothetical protein VHM22_00040 [Bradyrhizobium sp.]|nr:hypothetical protein [Bradyrhizobium sp.]